MRKVSALLREHLHFTVVVTLLTLVMTFPTIVNVFRTDVFWLPTGDSHDVYVKMWDVWYGEQFLTGRADRFYTDLMFYPDGLSLAYHPFFIPYVIVMNVLDIFFPPSNAYSLGYLLIIWLSALSAYFYLLWLFKDKWIALFGAVLFGFSPHVMIHPNHPPYRVRRHDSAGFVFPPARIASKSTAIRGNFRSDHRPDHCCQFVYLRVRRNHCGLGGMRLRGVKMPGRLVLAIHCSVGIGNRPSQHLANLSNDTGLHVLPSVDGMVSGKF